GLLVPGDPPGCELQPPEGELRRLRIGGERRVAVPLDRLGHPGLRRGDERVHVLDAHAELRHATPLGPQTDDPLPGRGVQPRQEGRRALSHAAGGSEVRAPGLEDREGVVRRHERALRLLPGLAPEEGAHSLYPFTTALNAFSYTSKFSVRVKFSITSYGIFVSISSTVIR